MTKRVTQEDIGRAAEVAGATVSRALATNWHQLGISSETHDRVFNAAMKLGYKRIPQVTVDRQTTQEVGLCFGHYWPCNIGVLMDLPNAMFLGAEERGWRVRCLPMLDGPASWKPSDGHGLIGIVILDNLAVDLEGVLGAIGDIPVVVVNWPTTLPVDQILADDQGGMALMAAHLHTMGHRRVLMVSKEAERHQSSLTARLTALHQSDLLIDEFYGTPDEAADHIARGHPATAVVAQGCYVAALLLAEFAIRGIRVPADLTLVSANDSPLLSYLTPPVTGVRVPIDHMIFAALDRIRERASESQVIAPIVLPEYLVHRASVGPPAQR